MTLNLNDPPFIMQLKARKCHFDLYWTIVFSLRHKQSIS